MNLNKNFNKFIYGIGGIPATYLESLSYEEQLLWFCENLKETMEALEELNTNVTNLSTDVDNLETTINNINISISNLETLINTIEASLSNYELLSNKVTSISSTSTDSEYPSAKCVYDLVGNVEDILTTLTTGSGV